MTSSLVYMQSLGNSPQHLLDSEQFERPTSRPAASAVGSMKAKTLDCTYAVIPSSAIPIPALNAVEPPVELTELNAARPSMAPEV